MTDHDLNNHIREMTRESRRAELIARRANDILATFCGDDVDEALASTSAADTDAMAAAVRACDATRLGNIVLSRCESYAWELAKRQQSMED